ncbi:sulfur carrier protein ThiS [Moraxella sp. Tifton1]|uniref:Sulfur carrier protein ThiS n=1 Tax=Moraxella oculi TaxID=2940516 RepID=A0ABW8U4L3_9GAMM|nr:sulfur carrier protein ThiS [Moraxella sp. Tifton1]MCL1623143.1 sulfur carrier protein ThiS [Moraxella sp. Tifton1]
MKNVILNGETHTTDKTCVLDLLTEVGATQGRFAVEIDGMLIPKSRLGDIVISDGMSIEVVQAVGGG